MRTLLEDWLGLTVEISFLPEAADYWDISWGSGSLRLPDIYCNGASAAFAEPPLTWEAPVAYARHLTSA
ncbi:MAG: hypothetical protein EOP11_22475, partial [Proteobacteria bacterium]